MNENQTPARITSSVGGYPELEYELLRQYRHRLPEHRILVIVEQCRDDLAGYSSSAMPEVLRRIAINRLDELCQPEGDPAASETAANDHPR